MSRPQWSTRSTAERLNAAHRRWSTTTEKKPKSTTEIGVLQFNEYGKKVNDMSNDPTNFNARVAAAVKENAEWHRQHPDGWAGTRGCNPANETERRALADAQAAVTRDLTYAEKQTIIDRLRKR